MGTRITDEDHVAMYDSVTDTAFGPVFESEQTAEAYIEWLGVDPRGLSSQALLDSVEDFLNSEWS